jgi:hypothetical protein
MRMRHSVILAASLFLGLPAVGAFADYVYTDINGQHPVFSFVCQTTKLCTGFVLMDSTGTEKATLANPVRTDPVGTTPQPVAQSGSWTASVIQGTGTNLHMVCDSGCSGSTAPADESAFTAGATSHSPVGGFFQTTATNNALTTGQMGAFQVTANRALFSNLRNAAGTEIATSGNPVRIDPVGTTPQPVTQSGAWPITNAGTFAVQDAAVEGAITSSVMQSNTKQVNGVTTLAGAGAVGTGSQRVAVGQDTTTIAGSAPGTAGTASGNVVTVQGVASMTPISVTEVNGAPLPGVSQAQTGAAASSLVAKASAGSIVSVSGSAANGSYIMIFNATSAPSDGAVTPAKCWGPMAAAGPFVFGWGGGGPVFSMSTGITVVSSSTGCFTKTATNAPFLAVEYQ